jgi:hypothetical protein
VLVFFCIPDWFFITFLTLPKIPNYKSQIQNKLQDERAVQGFSGKSGSFEKGPAKAH